MKKSPSLSYSHGGRWLCVCLLMGVGLLLYAKALKAPFFLDDAPTITLRPHWPSWQELPRQLPQDPRAVVTVSLVLNHAWGQLNPWGYHLFNILVHLINSMLLWGLASAHAMLGQWAEAYHAFASLLQMDPDHLDAIQRRGWLLATCPNAQVRPGQVAIALAQRGLSLTGGRDLRLWGARGVAYAETGQFKKAIDTMTQAIRLARQQPPLAKRFEARKQLYQQHQPYRLGSKK